MTTFTFSSKICNEEHLCGTNECTSSIVTYCIRCNLYLCQNCLQIHKYERHCPAFHSARYSQIKESVLPYCDIHDCFENYGCYDFKCSDGFIPVCVYCAELNHKGHEIMMLNQFTQKFLEPTLEHLRHIEEDEKLHQELQNDAGATSKALQSNAVRNTLEKWKLSILSKVLCALKYTEKYILYEKEMELFRDIKQISSKSSAALNEYGQIKEKVNSYRQKSSLEIISQAKDICSTVADVKVAHTPEYTQNDIKGLFMATNDEPKLKILSICLRNHFW